MLLHLHFKKVCCNTKRNSKKPWYPCFIQHKERQACSESFHGTNNIMFLMYLKKKKYFPLPCYTPLPNFRLRNEMKSHLPACNKYQRHWIAIYQIKLLSLYILNSLILLIDCSSIHDTDYLSTFKGMNHPRQNQYLNFPWFPFQHFRALLYKYQPNFYRIWKFLSSLDISMAYGPHSTKTSCTYFYFTLTFQQIHPYYIHDLKRSVPEIKYFKVNQAHQANNKQITKVSPT